MLAAGACMRACNKQVVKQMNEQQIDVMQNLANEMEWFEMKHNEMKWNGLEWNGKTIAQ